MVMDDLTIPHHLPVTRERPVRRLLLAVTGLATVIELFDDAVVELFDEEPDRAAMANDEATGTAAA